MRTSFSSITTVVAVLFTIAAVSLSGCQSSFKMPSAPSWWTFGKKKPSSSFASKPDTQYPSPSQTATPGQPQSYAQTRGMGSNYGARPGGTQYSNASYGRSGASSNQGFFSGDYAKQGAQPSVNGGYGGTASPSQASKPAGSRSTYGSYGANGFTPSGGASSTGQPWPSNDRASQYGAIRSDGYGQPTTRGTVSQPDTYGATGPNDFRQDPVNYARAPSTYSNPKGASTYSGIPSGAGSVPPTSVPAVASGQYRPGSTARETQYGDSQNINVRGIRPASYGADGVPSDSRSVTKDSQAEPARYGSQQPQTATEQFPYTNSSIYR